VHTLFCPTKKRIFFTPTELPSAAATELGRLGEAAWLAIVHSRARRDWLGLPFRMFASTLATQIATQISPTQISSWPKISATQISFPVAGCSQSKAAMSLAGGRASTAGKIAFLMLLQP
jgi:hypothetical protein